MLTNQLTDTLNPDRKRRAVSMGNSVVVISGLIPWSIACAVPLSVISGSPVSIFFAVYLFLIPLCYLFSRDNRREKVKAEKLVLSDIMG